MPSRRRRSIVLQYVPSSHRTPDYNGPVNPVTFTVTDIDGPVRGAEQATCLIAREREPSEESQQLKAFGIADQALP